MQHHSTISVALLVVVLISLLPWFNLGPQTFASDGQEISITLDSAEFVPLSGGEGNQVNMFVNYGVDDSSLVNQRINSVMKVYATDGTLIKTSSSSDGFIVDESGSQHHATTITNSTSQNVIAVVQFTDLTKTMPLSNPLQVNLTLTKVPLIPETRGGINWIQTCQQLDAILIPSCDSLVYPNNVLTGEGERARVCIQNGIALAGGGALLQLPLPVITPILQALSEPTGCGGIIEWDYIGNVDGLKGIIDIFS